jgi:ribosomal protein L16 Arg81 hydroxylase
MTLQDAITVIKQYGNAFENHNENGIARYESWLSCPKQNIVLAFKLVFAHLIEHRQLSQTRFDRLIVPLMALDSFVSNEEAQQIDRIHKRLENNQVTVDELEIYALYMKKSFTSEQTVTHMVDFVNLIMKLDPQDSLFYEKVCTFAGIEYTTEVEESLRPTVS